MTDLLSRPFLRRAEPAWGSRVPWLAGVLAAAWALVAGLAIAALPAMLVWIDEGAAAPVGDPVRIGAQIWLAGHRVDLQLDDTDVRFAPLGLTVVVMLLLYRAARWAAHTAGVDTARRAIAVMLPVIGIYAAGAAGLSAWSTTAHVVIHPTAAFVWAGCVATVAAGGGVVHEADLGYRLADRLPASWVSVLRAAVVAVAGLLVVGSVLVAVSAVTNSGRIAARRSARTRPAGWRWRWPGPRSCPTRWSGPRPTRSDRGLPSGPAPRSHPELSSWGSCRLCQRWPRCRPRRPARRAGWFWPGRSVSEC